MVHIKDSPRTLWTMRDIVTQHNLQQKLFDLDPSKQRLDSVHI